MKHLLAYSAFLFLVCACRKENVVIPDTGRKIVINGLITTDSFLNVRIAKSYYFKDFLMGWAQFPEFDSADVRFYRNNILLDSLPYSVQSDRYDLYPTSNYKSDHILPLPGNEYKIIVKKAGYPDATATTTIPRLVKIEKIDTSSIETRGSNFVINCGIEFTDPPAEKNFYLFNIIRLQTVPLSSRYLAFDSFDPIIEEELCSNSGSGSSISAVYDKYGFAFSDKLIDGKKYSLNVSFKAPPHPKIACICYFRLISITEEYFKFIHTLNLYNATYLNPLAEPVMVFSNVSGGYGIFAGAAVSTDSIIFHN
jgi:hypothetical protein